MVVVSGKSVSIKEASLYNYQEAVWIEVLHVNAYCIIQQSGSTIDKCEHNYSIWSFWHKQNINNDDDNNKIRK
jgi:hypothetical protein